MVVVVVVVVFVSVSVCTVCLQVVIATVLELPVSSTHCQVGAVFCVGLVADGSEHVSWRMLGKIAATWVVTLPFAGGLAAFMTFVLSKAIES